MTNLSTSYVEEFKNEFHFLFPHCIIKETRFDERSMFGVLTEFEVKTQTLWVEISIYDTGIYLILLLDNKTYDEVLNLAWLKEDDLLDKNRKRDFTLLKEALNSQ